MNIIPLPNHIQSLGGNFSIHTDTSITYPAQWADSIQLFVTLVEKVSGIHLAQGEGNIQFSVDPAIAQEGYNIECTPDCLRVFASTGAGAFYAVATLRQLFDLDSGVTRAEPTCECVSIQDYPCYKWRGFMLDNARNFFGKADILRLIDLISMQKYNILHLHLTDDQGWRVEIDKYPLLNQVGSMRAGTIHRKNGVKASDGIPHGGYLTKNDLREIVAYAAARYITVVPEIDMPGHMTAMLAAYPELSCTGKQIEVAQGGGIYQDILCAGNPKVYRMLEDIITEFLEIFPAPYFHIGGDEAPKINWKKCPKCQAVMKENHLPDENALQAHFTNHFVDFLKQHGKRAIGWSECINPKLDGGVILQHWKMGDEKTAAEQINLGRETILSSFLYTYLDYPYAMTSLKKTYNFQPILHGVKPENEKYVIGVETPVWTECIHTTQKLDYMIFPRIAAISEVAWTEHANKNFSDFIKRLKNYYKTYSALGVNYARDKETPVRGIRRMWIVKKYFKKDEDFEYDQNR